MPWSGEHKCQVLCGGFHTIFFCCKGLGCLRYKKLASMLVDNKSVISELWEEKGREPPQRNGSIADRSGTRNDLSRLGAEPAKVDQKYIFDTVRMAVI